MMYPIHNEKIPQHKRAEVNQHVLLNINRLTPETIFNSYTGIGGLHRLNFSDYDNFHEYSRAKKEIELGQFFTPHEICQQMAGLASPRESDLVLDMCCGMGNFFNYLPNHLNAHGFDIDENAVRVAKRLYPDAHISVDDLQFYNPEQRFDYIIGNPPFNIEIGGVKSQLLYFHKAFWMLNPAGIIIVIVPLSFLSNEFWNGTEVEMVERDFSFIGQTELASNAFASVGVANFRTKIMAFMRKSSHIEHKAYSAERFIPMDELKAKINEAKALKEKVRIQIQRETLSLTKDEMQAYEYRLKKYLYELKTQPRLKGRYLKAVALVTKFQNQKCPDNATEEEPKRWEDNKLTYPKVLGILKKYIKTQYKPNRKEIALVQVRGGFKLKEYAPRLLDGSGRRSAKFYHLVSGNDLLPAPKKMTEKNKKQFETAGKVIARRKKEYELQNTPFMEMARSETLDAYIDTLRFINKEGLSCEFTPLQKHDMGLLYQKRYSILNWQQGSGKTAVLYHYGRYLMHQNKVRNVVLLAPPNAVSMTWIPFLKRNNVAFVELKKVKDIETIPQGAFIIVPLSILEKLKRRIKLLLRGKTRKLALLFDECDEITNESAKCTRLSIALFRRIGYKMLGTGTTTRNNITELYPQLELLLNNSANMLSYSRNCYYEDKEKIIREKDNKYYLQPFPARYGATHFKECFNPGKTTVFGIEQQNQDLYNKDILWELIQKSMITRKFREFAGDKYTAVTHYVDQSEAEQELYRIILQEFYSICWNYFNKTGDSRKDSQLKIVQQMKLLIRACSTPNYFSEYTGSGYPEKVKYIQNMLEKRNQKVTIGCTSHNAVELYSGFVRNGFPGRPLFIITGRIPLDKRQKVLDKFEATANGILVCTQQSLESSVNIPSCDEVILESLQWNIPRMEQFYFRFIRLDSKNHTHVHFITYNNSIEQNLMALVLTKERLNDFIKSGEVTEQSEIFDEFNVSPNMIEQLLRREKNEDGTFSILWGSQKVG